MTALPPINPHDWATLAPHFAALQAEPLAAERVPAWLARWSDLEKQVWEARAGLKAARSRDERDATAQAAWATFVETVFTPFEAAGQGLIAKLLAVPNYNPAPDHRQFVRLWRSQAEAFGAANVRRAGEISTLAGGYWPQVAGYGVLLDGGEVPLAQAETHLTAPDRAGRETAWRAIHNRWLADRSVLDDLFLRLVRERQALAAQAGFPDYRAYRWRELDRSDYTPDDCMTFHDAVAAELGPLIKTLLRRKQAALALPTLRPWDLRAEPAEATAWQPFRTVAEVVAATAAICDRLDPDLGALFRRMQAAGHLDPDTRPGKATGGEEWFFQVTGLPYIRVSLTGTVGDLPLILHETGHGFHDWLSATAQPLMWNLGGASGFEEFPSTALSYLGLPVLAEVLPGPEAAAGTAAEVRRQLVETVIRWLPDVLRRDAWQHWLYAQPADSLTPAALDAAWIRLSNHFLPGVDWAGLAAEQGVGWQRIGTLFGYPFYDLEYALAHLGAIQLWAHARRDPAGTWAAYRRALSAGFTLPVGEAYAAAGVALPFAPAVIREVTTFIAEMLT
jgi:oligoendopeptidase F